MDSGRGRIQCLYIFHTAAALKKVTETDSGSATGSQLFSHAGLALSGPTCMFHASQCPLCSFRFIFAAICVVGPNKL